MTAEELASRVDALRAGALDLSVDAAVTLATVLSVGPDELTAAFAPRPPSGDSPADRLGAARWHLMQLDARQRQALVDAHRARQATAAATDAADAALTSRIQRWTTRAEQIRAFMARELDPQVDPRPLLLTDFTDPVLVEALRLELGIEPPPEPPPTRSDEPSARAPRSEPDPEADAPEAGDSQNDAAEGPPSGPVEPENPAESTGPAEPAAAPPTETVESRVAEPAASRPDREQPEPTPPQPPQWTEAELNAARAWIGAVLAFRRLPEAEQEALFVNHAQRLLAAQKPPESELDQRAKEVEAEAEAAQKQASDAAAQAQEAAREREAALQQARQARDTKVRTAAQERARLLGVTEAQARFEERILGNRAAVRAEAREAIDLRKQVQDLAERIERGDALREEADRLWDPLIERLTTERKGLASSVDQLTDSDVEVPGAGRPVDSGSIPDGERAALDELRQKVRDREQSLVTLARTVRWEAADGRVESVLILDEARLMLLQWMTSDERSRVTGFNAVGLEQVLGAIGQARLLVQYRVMSLPRAGRELVTRLLHHPLDVLFAAIQLIALLFAFRWWRRRGDEILQNMLSSATAARPQTRQSRGIATMAFYLLRIRRPLDWLILLNAVVWLSGVEQLPEVRLSMLVVRWLLIGAIVVQLLDGIAARYTTFADRRTDTGNLRYRSLRLVGRMVVGIGLALSFTEAAVGRGAIYSWVLSTCWIVSVPVAIAIIYWWRDIIYERISKRRKRSPILEWALGTRNSRLRYLGAAAGGVYLLVEGVYRWALLRISQFPLARRAHAWLFHREITKQARAREAEADLSPLSGPEWEALAPDQAGPTFDSVPRKNWTAALECIEAPGANMVAVTGERGAGKSRTLDQVAAAVTARATDGQTTVLRLRCGPQGYAELIRSLKVELGLDPSGSDEGVMPALAATGFRAVLVDDAHNLIRPVVRGLADLDRLRALIRSGNMDLTWVLAIDAVAWAYVARARGVRPIFDEVVRVEPWPEELIGELLMERTSAAGIDPSFEGLVLPSQLAPEQAMDETEIARRGYFRLLWDYSAGNPTVAQWFWRESLQQRASGGVLVRLFDVPDTTRLEAMPLNLHFVLRAILQLDLAATEDIVQATRLRPDQVGDCLRFLRSHGYVERVGDRSRIHSRWYRAITRVLARQHLITS